MRFAHRHLPILLVCTLFLSGCGEAADRPAADPTTGDTARDTAAATAGASADPASPGSDPAASDDDGPVPLTDYPRLRASVCDTILNTFACARAIEALQLTAAEGVHRTGDTLRLSLEGGDAERLVDEGTEGSDVRAYSYQGTWPATDLSLVQLQFYEGSRYLLVDRRTGERTELPDWPLIAPGDQPRRFAVLSLDLVAGYGPNTLQVWSVDGSEPTLEWETRPSDWGPADGEWADARTLRFTQRGPCEGLGATGRGMCERPAELRLEGDAEGAAWRVDSVGDASPRQAEAPGVGSVE